MSQHMPETFFINFSNNKRKKVESINSKTLIKRKSSLLEQYLFNFVPVAVSSTILSPLNRIKILLQIQKPGGSSLIKESLNTPSVAFSSN